jgi:uncharacterized protein (TIGR02646 family)
MRKIQRRPIEQSSQAVLADLQKQVDASPAKVAKAAKLWKARRRGQERAAAFKDIRRTLNKMAHGRQRCMYCEDNSGEGIDHFRPRALYPDRAFSWPNYLLACSHCNSNNKRDEFPLDRAKNPLLINPADEEPGKHFTFVPGTGRLVASTARGKATARVFGLNRNERLKKGRQDTWEHLLHIVQKIGEVRKDRRAVARQLELARRLSFQSVVHHLVTESLRGSNVVPRKVAAIVRAAPGDWAWAL